MVAAGEDAPLAEEAKAHSMPPPPPPLFLQNSTYFTRAGSSGLKEM